MGVKGLGTKQHARAVYLTEMTQTDDGIHFDFCSCSPKNLSSVQREWLTGWLTQLVRLSPTLNKLQPVQESTGYTDVHRQHSTFTALALTPTQSAGNFLVHQHKPVQAKTLAKYLNRDVRPNTDTFYVVTWWSVYRPQPPQSTQTLRVTCIITWSHSI